MHSITNGVMLRLGLVQVGFGNHVDANVHRLLELIRIAADRGAQIVCLPALLLTSYFSQAEGSQAKDIADPIPGQMAETLANTADQLKVVLAGTMFKRTLDGNKYHSTVAFDANGEMVGKYRNKHFCNRSLSLESFYFSPGDTSIPAWETRYGKLAVLANGDAWYPEAARMAARAGAEVVICSTDEAWQSMESPAAGMKRREAWETMLRSHAIANGLFIAAVNRVGEEGDLTFWGRSFVTDPMGAVIGRSDDQEEVLIVEIDRSCVECVRREWSFLRYERGVAY